MILINIYFAWCWFLMGLLSGMIQGLRFHRDDWMGGYNSWPRRLTRLGHIAFFGTGMLNLLFAFTVLLTEIDHDFLTWASPLLIAGAFFMSGICYLSAWRKAFRQLFFLPVLCLVSGTTLFTCALLGHAIQGG